MKYIVSLEFDMEDVWQDEVEHRIDNAISECQSQLETNHGIECEINYKTTK